MQANFELSLLILLTVSVVLLAFVAAEVLRRLLRLEKTLQSGAADPFSGLVGRRVPTDLRFGEQSAFRVILLSEDCRSCSAVARRLVAEPPADLTVVVWKAGGLSDLVDGGSIRVLRNAGELFTDLGIRVTPVELLVEGERIRQVRPVVFGRTGNGSLSRRIARAASGKEVSVQ